MDVLQEHIQSVLPSPWVASVVGRNWHSFGINISTNEWARMMVDLEDGQIRLENCRHRGWRGDSVYYKAHFYYDLSDPNSIDNLIERILDLVQWMNKQSIPKRSSRN